MTKPDFYKPIGALLARPTSALIDVATGAEVRPSGVAEGPSEDSEARIQAPFGGRFCMCPESVKAECGCPNGERYRMARRVLETQIGRAHTEIDRIASIAKARGVDLQ